VDNLIKKEEEQTLFYNIKNKKMEEENKQ